MANICCGEVYFKGFSGNLMVINDVLNSFIKEKKKISLIDLKEKLGLDYDADFKYAVQDFDYDGNNLLRMSFEFAWDCHADYLNAIAKKYDLKWSGLFDVEGEGYFKVDPLDVFKENYLVDIHDDNNLGLPNEIFEFFIETNEVAEYLNKASGQNCSYKEWKETLDEADIGGIYEIEEEFL